MRYGNHRGFAHGGMTHERIFEVRRTDPFAAGFDQVFAAVHNLDATFRVHGGNVAGAEPSVRSPAVLRCGSVVITGSHPGAAHFKFSGGLAIAGRFAVWSSDAEINKRKR